MSIWDEVKSTVKINRGKLGHFFQLLYRLTFIRFLVIFRPLCKLGNEKNQDKLREIEI